MTEEAQSPNDGSERRVAEQTRETAAVNEAPKKEIIERRQSEEAMRQSERCFRDAFDHAPIGMTLTGPYGRWLKVNRVFCEMLGYSEQELLGMTIQSVTHPGDLDANLEGFRRLLAGETQRFSMEKRFFRKDGRTVWVEVSSTVVKSADGNPRYYISHMQDITGRKRSGEQIHFQASLLDQIRNEMIAIDLEQKIIVWNRYAETLFQWTSEEALGRNVVELLASTENRGAAEEALASLKESGYLEGEFILQRKDGGVFPVYISAAGIKGGDGAVVGFAVVCADITERKLREEALREAQERADFLLEGTVDTHLFFDRQWRYIYVNEAAVRAMGRLREEILGRTLWDLYPDIVGSELEHQYRRAMEERIPLAFEFHYLTTDTWWENRFFPSPGGLTVFATDITDRKRAEQRAEESQRLFAVFMENLPGFAWVKDIQGRYVYANKRLEQLEPCRDGCIGKTDAELWPPEIAARHRENDQKVITARETVLAVEPYLASGEQHYVIVSKFPILDAAGAVSLLGGISVDITDRERAEEQLRQSEERFRQLAENIENVFWMTNPEKNQVLYVSPAYEKIWGRSCRSLYEQPAAWMDAIHPEDRGRVVKAAMTQQVAGDYHEEYRIIRPDGSVRWIRDRAFPVKDPSGRVYRITGIAEDITERREGEERLREYEKVVEGLEEMIVVVDRESNYLTANRAFLRYQGLKKDQLVGRSVPDLLGNELFEKVVKKKLDECLKGKVVKCELRYNYLQLGERDVSISYFPIEGPAGIDRAACVLQDITERKRAEVALADYAKRLQSLSGRLLEAQETERRRIARELHDEIGQSLTAIKIHLHAAQRLSKNPKSKLKECVQIVDQALIQTQNLSLNLHPPQLDELGLVVALRWHLDRQANAAGLIPYFSADPLPAHLHPNLEIACFRVVQEAITNVIRHAAASRVSVQLFQHGSDLHLVIRDDGLGFNTEAAQRRAAQGTSLGLVGMRERVELAGGRMELNSSPGKGTEIHAVFPWPILFQENNQKGGDHETDSRPGGG